MRILITGSRDWPMEYEGREVIRNAILDLANEYPIDWDEVTIVHGHCPTGADAIANSIGKMYGLKVERHPADWERFGKYAGPKRNKEMVDLGADVCLAFPIGASRGTRGCMKLAKDAGIPVKDFDPARSV